MEPVLVDVNAIKIFLICLLIIAVIILVIYGIVVLFNLVKTLKQAQKVMADFEVVSAVASKRTKQLDEAIEKSSKKLKAASGIGGSITSAIPIIISVVTAILKATGAKQKDNSK